jgi:hypothetical protein
MVCSSCGREINDGEKCNDGLTNKNSQAFSYLSLILSVVGTIGTIVFQHIFYEDFSRLFWLLTSVSRLFIYAGIIFAIITLYKHKSKLAFIAGLIPCVYYILLLLPEIFQFFRNL